MGIARKPSRRVRSAGLGALLTKPEISDPPGRSLSSLERPGPALPALPFTCGFFKPAVLLLTGLVGQDPAHLALRLFKFALLTAALLLLVALLLLTELLLLLVELLLLAADGPDLQADQVLGGEDLADPPRGLGDFRLGHILLVLVLLISHSFTSPGYYGSDHEKYSRQFLKTG